MTKEELIKIIESVNSNEITYVNISFKAIGNLAEDYKVIEIRYNS